MPREIVCWPHMHEHVCPREHEHRQTRGLREEKERMELIDADIPFYFKTIKIPGTFLLMACPCAPATASCYGSSHVWSWRACSMDQSLASAQTSLSQLLSQAVQTVILGICTMNLMVSFVSYSLQISLMEFKKNVYCLLWMATPTARGKSR